MSERVNSGPVQPQGVGEDPLFHYTKIFVRFLQLVFGTFEKGSYRWDSDPNTTDILISDQAQLSREVIEKRPAIIVARGPAAFGNISIDQFAKLDADTGKRTHTDLVSCTMTYNCIAEEGLEAQRIAWIAMMATRRLKRTLMKSGQIHRVGEDVQVGSESSPGALISPEVENEAVLVSVSVPFYFQDYWSVEPVDKVLLKNLDIALTSQIKFPADETSVAIKEPGINGRILTYDKTLNLTQRVRVNRSTPKPRK